MSSIARLDATFVPSSAPGVIISALISSPSATERAFRLATRCAAYTNSKLHLDKQQTVLRAEGALKEGRQASSRRTDLQDGV